MMMEAGRPAAGILCAGTPTGGKGSTRGPPQSSV